MFKKFAKFFEKISKKLWRKRRPVTSMTATTIATSTAAANITSNRTYADWHRMAAEGNINELLRAIERNEINPLFILNNEGETVWHTIVRHGHVDEIFKLIAARKFKPEFVATNTGVTVLHLLVQYGYGRRYMDTFNRPLSEDLNRTVAWRNLITADCLEPICDEIVKNKDGTISEHLNLGKILFQAIINSGKFKRFIDVLKINGIDPAEYRFTDYFNSSIKHSILSEGLDLRYSASRDSVYYGDSIVHLLARYGYYKELTDCIFNWHDICDIPLIIQNVHFQYPLQLINESEYYKDMIFKTAETYYTGPWGIRMHEISGGEILEKLKIKSELMTFALSAQKKDQSKLRDFAAMPEMRLRVGEFLGDEAAALQADKARGVLQLQ